MKKIAAIMILLFSLTSFSQTTTFIVLRHAEKESTDKNANLSSDGKLRAEALRHVLSTSGVNAIYSTPFNRTRQTVTPLAEEKKIVITEYPVNKPYTQLIAEILDTYLGKTVVVVGHSNTVPEILKVLSDNLFIVSISENQYDNLYIVSVTKEKIPEVVPMKYGKSTP